MLDAFTFFATFFILWWLMFFIALPFGIRSHHEQGDVIRGTEPGAPVQHGLVRKIVLAAAAAAAVTVLIQVVLALGIIPSPDVSFERPQGPSAPVAPS
jgi:predicted secreted protein